MSRHTVFTVAALFNVSPETVRKWCIEYENHLSPRANPGNNRTRILNEDDIRVLSLVAERRAGEVSYEDIHVELRSGAQGFLPDLTDTKKDVELREQLARLSLFTERLEEEAEGYKTRLLELENFREQSIRTLAQVELERQRADRAEIAIQDLIKERRELDREIARLTLLLEQLQNKPPSVPE